MHPIPQIVHADLVAPQPWKNGGGRTRALLVWPSPSDWSLRVSVADIEQDGPFSPFPGAERWFAVIEGEGVVLPFADGERRRVPGDAPLVFAGAGRGASLKDKRRLRTMRQRSNAGGKSPSRAG